MIEFRGVTKRFDTNTVLRDVSFRVERGETRVIVGQSGQGKSVTLKIVCGLLTPDRGEVWIEDQKIEFNRRASRAFLREKVNMLFQSSALFDSLNVRENVGFALYERSRLPRRDIDRRVTETLRLVNLTGIEHLMPADLSGGMKKRVGLARALISNPEIMLYDEPTSGLDPVTSDLINDLIIATQRRANVTSLVVTHDMASAYKIGDRISMLEGGDLIATGTPDEIRNSPDERVRQFIEGRSEGPLTRTAPVSAAR